MKHELPLKRLHSDQDPILRFRDTQSQQEPAKAVSIVIFKAVRTHVLCRLLKFEPSIPRVNSGLRQTDAYRGVATLWLLLLPLSKLDQKLLRRSAIRSLHLHRSAVNPHALHQTLMRLAPHLFEDYQQQDVQESLASITLWEGRWNLGMTAFACRPLFHEQGRLHSREDMKLGSHSMKRDVSEATTLQCRV